MSESGGSGSGSDRGPDGTGVEYGEVALVLAVVAALVVAAALLPGTGMGGGELGGGEEGQATTTAAATATPESGGGGSDAGEGQGSNPAGSFPGGSPSGVTLSNPPPETQIGSTQASGGALPQTPQFVVEAPRNTYWRQTAYTEYTGSTWAGSPRWQPIDAGVPNDAQTANGAAMDYEVTLLVSSSSLPTAWQPSQVGVPNASAGVEASSVGGVRATRRLPAETTYRARSVAPPSSASALRSAGTDYPDEVSTQYTQVPAATPDRVGEFTSDLTADAETPYGAAVRVRDWLKQKPYSLNASHEPGEPVADQFIFEMEKGYCQYYATSMAVMLRTQGIPARYVVGYAGGKSVGDDRYLVTADRGHAWVEVYFPDVGWVPFDPTASGQLPVENPQPPYDISLNRSAVAGADVTVTVAKNGTPVVGAPVDINDERVGWTGADGTVTTRLPYDAEFTVTARPPNAATKYESERAAKWAGGPALSARGTVVRADHEDGTGNHSSRDYRSDTNVTLAVEGDPVAGGAVTVRTTIEDVPVREATVTLDGERVGTTDENGTLGVSLTDISPGDHRLAVRRDAVSGATTVTVREPSAEPTTSPAPTEPPPLNLSVSAPLSLPLPGQSATVRTTRNGTPIAGATVAVGGRTVGTTDENGTLAVDLPVQGSVAVVARDGGGATARVTLPLFRNAGIVGGLVVGLLLAVGWVLRRRGVTARGVATRARAALSRLGAWATAACLRAADLFVRAGKALERGLRALAALPGRLVTQGLAALSMLDPRRLVAWLRRLWRRRGANGDGAAGASGATGGAVGGGEASTETTTLRTLWRDFVALVSPPQMRTQTPGEIARYAVERGLPAEPVRKLTEAYRDAEYGRLAPDEGRLARARDALESVRESVRGGSS